MTIIYENTEDKTISVAVLYSGYLYSFTHHEYPYDTIVTSQFAESQIITDKWWEFEDKVKANMLKGFRL